MFNKVKSLAACMFMMILVSCGSKQSQKSPFIRPSSPNQSYDSGVVQQEVFATEPEVHNQFPCEKKQVKNFASGIEHLKGIDISAPLGYRLVEQEQARYFVYVGSFSIAQLRDFYVREMERLGWNFTSFAADSESLFVCHSLTHSCAISLRPGDRRHETRIHIFVRLKDKKRKTELV